MRSTGAARDRRRHRRGGAAGRHRGSPRGVRRAAAVGLHRDDELAGADRCGSGTAPSTQSGRPVGRRPRRRARRRLKAAGRSREAGSVVVERAGSGCGGPGQQRLHQRIAVGQSPDVEPAARADDRRSRPRWPACRARPHSPTRPVLAGIVGEDAGETPLGPRRPAERSPGQRQIGRMGDARGIGPMHDAAEFEVGACARPRP